MYRSGRAPHSFIIWSLNAKFMFGIKALAIYIYIYMNFHVFSFGHVESCAQKIWSSIDFAFSLSVFATILMETESTFILVRPVVGKRKFYDDFGRIQKITMT